MTGIELLGWLGFGVLVAAWIPQTWETIMKGKTSMNIAFIILYFSSSLMLTIYSIMIDNTIYTTLNALLTIGSGINLYFKLLPRKSAE
ncbi:MAG: hypothetical protein WD016_06735 [Balneolaceae bacterium]